MNRPPMVTDFVTEHAVITYLTNKGYTPSDARQGYMFWARSHGIQCPANDEFTVKENRQ